MNVKSNNDEGIVHIIEFIACFTVVIFLLSNFLTVYAVKMEGFPNAEENMDKFALLFSDNIISSTGKMKDGSTTWEYVTGDSLKSLQSIGIADINKGVSYQKCISLSNVDYTDFRKLTGLIDDGYYVNLEVYDLKKDQNIISYGDHPQGHANSRSSMGFAQRIVFLNYGNSNLDTEAYVNIILYR